MTLKPKYFISEMLDEDNNLISSTNKYDDIITTLNEELHKFNKYPEKYNTNEEIAKRQAMINQQEELQNQELIRQQEELKSNIIEIKNLTR